MKNTLVFPILFLFSSFFLTAQTEGGNAEYSFIAYWKKNEVLQYEVTKGKIKTDSEGKVDSTGRRSKLTLTVTDSTDQRYLVDVRYDSDLNFAELGYGTNEWGKLVNDYKNAKLQYETDENGSFVELKNTEMIQKVYKAVLDMMIKTKDLDSGKKKMVESLKDLYSSPEYIKEKAFEEFRMLHFPYGRVYPLDSLIVFDEQLPNVINPEKPIPAVGTVKMILDNEEEGIGYFFYTLSVDEDAAKALTTQVADRIDLKKKDKKEIEGLKMTINDSTTYIVELSTGTILSMYRERTIGVNDEVSVEFIEMNIEN